MTTKRYPRTLEEAFGPYQRYGLQTEYDPMPKADRIVVVISVITAAVLGALIFTGVIA